MAGVDMDISGFYPPIKFPVSRGTPMISPVIKWNHETNHFVPYLDTRARHSRRSFIINLSDKKFEFMKGHVVSGRTLFPVAGWIYYVWETLAFILGEPLEKLKVVFEDVKFQRATTLIENHDIIVTISIHSGKYFIFVVVISHDHFYNFNFVHENTRFTSIT
jgi:fatty acid synthase, animal type